MGKEWTYKDAKLIWWWYDDGITIGSALKRGKKYKLPALLKNESDRNKHSKQLEKIEKEKDWTIQDKGPKDLPVGIEAFSEDYFTAYGKGITFGKETFQAFVEMTQPTWAADERAVVVELIAAILSAYVMRPTLDSESKIEVEAMDEKDIRALYVTISHAENGMLGLRRIAESMIVSTAVDDGRFKFYVPTVIQTRITGEIIEEANLHLKNCGYQWPAPYRDTAVLLDVRGFKNKDIEKFASLNPWCTCLLYGKNLKLTSGYQIHMKGMAFSQLKAWDKQAVHELVEAYVAHVPILFEDEQSLFPRAWVQAGNLIQRYIDTKHKLDGAERYKTKVLLASILSFLNFTQTVCGVTDDEMRPFCKNMVNLLLPGVFKKEPNKQAAIEKPLDVFEEVLKKALTAENFEHFYHMPGKRGEVWPGRQTDGTEIWGYIRNYAWQKGEPEEPCLVLLQEALRETIAKEVAPDVQGFSDVLRALSKETVPYIHKTDNAKVKRTEKDTAKSEKALRLRISALPIDENIRKRLLTP